MNEIVGVLKHANSCNNGNDKCNEAKNKPNYKHCNGKVLVWFISLGFVADCVFVGQRLIEPSNHKDKAKNKHQP